MRGRDIGQRFGGGEEVTSGTIPVEKNVSTSGKQGPIINGDAHQVQAFFEMRNRSPNRMIADGETGHTPQMLESMLDDSTSMTSVHEQIVSSGQKLTKMMHEYRHAPVTKYSIRNKQSLKRAMEEHLALIDKGTSALSDETTSTNGALPASRARAISNKIADWGLVDKIHDTSLNKLSAHEMIDALRASTSIATVRERSQQVVNPLCTLADLDDDDAAELEDEIAEGNIPSNQIHLLIDEKDFPEPPQETPEPSEPFYLVSKTTTPSYQSTCIDIALGAPQGNTRVKLRAIADSGAAWCALKYDYVLKHMPTLMIKPTTKRFHDASGGGMVPVGTAVIAVELGDMTLFTTAFIFRNLPQNFLLGTNTLAEHKLDISYSKGLIYSTAPIASEASQTPLITTRSTHCPQCESEGSQHGAHCKCNDYQVVCDGDSCCLYVTSRGGETRKLSCVRSTAARPKAAISSVNESVATSPRPKISKHSQSAPPAEAIDMVTSHASSIPAGTTRAIRLRYARFHPGKPTTMHISLSEEFVDHLNSLGLRVVNDCLHSSLNKHAFVRVSNTSSERQHIQPGTHAGLATPHVTKRKRGARPHAISLLEETHGVTLRTKLDYRASPMEWKCIGDSPPQEAVLCMNGKTQLNYGRALKHSELAARLPTQTTFTDQDMKLLGVNEKLYLSHYILADDGKYYSPTSELSFELGGRPTTHEHLRSLKLDFEDCHDPSQDMLADGTYPPLPQDKKDRLYDAALRWWYVWSRDARTPDISHLVILEVPTGDAQPIAQKPYPLPYQYLDAVRQEVQALLDGGLIEPCISNWASPVLVRLKKDSTPDCIRLKLIIDYRRLNEVTVPDAAGLGDQEEILDGFGGDQRFTGIVDAAGGFYQYLIKPSDRHKTAFVLPTSMGGTTFQWRVAPYGLTRNPAGYSRGMMYALKGLDHCSLAEGTANGGAKSWIDDVSMHANSFDGFLDLFETILVRLSAAGMSLKASKCFLLKPKLEVLGYYITPRGVVMQGDKLADLSNKGPPVSVKEVRIFMGVVQFYRRFVPRIAMLSAPMNNMLKKHKDNDPRYIKGTPEHKAAWAEVAQSFDGIMLFLRSSAVMAAPDLGDPNAEYVIVPDACDIAAGGAMLQWQWPRKGWGPGPPAGTPMRGGLGPDPLTQSWRLGTGWELRTIGYFSKTFNSAQQNYPTFDQEAAAVLFCCRRWAKLITGRPTTVYTDSAVASTMLTKHLGPPRLQRWGMELGTFLPYLKIQYRKGSENGFADFLSRYPTFKKYYVTERDKFYLAPAIFDVLQSVPLFTHDIADEDERKLLQGWSTTILESPRPAETSAFWQSTGSQEMIRRETADTHVDDLSDQINALREVVTDQDFWKEQDAFNSHVDQWVQYVDIFRATHGRDPILWDLCCGEGGYSRGARECGLQCYGFDKNAACQARYEFDMNPNSNPSPSGMTFVQADVLDLDFWKTLGDASGEWRPGIPLPDIIHASPPCWGYSNVTKVSVKQTFDQKILDTLIVQLKNLEDVWRDKHHSTLVWEIENVPASKPFVHQPVNSLITLCGTMMGHRVFRHRVFYCNYAASAGLSCHHEGKVLGSRGVHLSKERDRGRWAHLPTPNMYGVYSRPYEVRGSADEWHGAIGFPPQTFSTSGLSGALPLGYGRLLAPQMVAHLMQSLYSCPIFPPFTRTPHEEELLDVWAKRGYSVLSESFQELATVNATSLVADSSPLLPVTEEENEVSDGTDDDPTATDANDAQTGSPQEELITPEEPPSELMVTLAEQMADPALRNIRKKLLEDLPTTASNVRKAKHALLQEQYLIGSDKLLKVRTFSDLGEAKNSVVYVPETKRTALMRFFHYINHRGGGPLHDQLKRSYYWPSMEADCTTFVTTCRTCEELKSRPLQRAPTHAILTPSKPFEVIHVDHKSKLQQSGNRYNHILVVTCALTRFTLFIPVESETADETLRALLAKVFCVFGNPAVMVTDNGPSFISGLMAAASKFYGYRHVHIMPYNAQANGVAESSVGRIKALLDRHCKEHREWHKVLPILQAMLNSTTMTTLGVSPFAALFGREPPGLEQLEDPSLYPEARSGDTFLETLRERLLRTHEILRVHSDLIKKARASEENLRKYSRLETSRLGEIIPSDATTDRYVWLLHGSQQQADYTRKRGHGTAWKHKYKLLDVRPHAVLLEIPTDGSVPRVHPWQLRRRVVRASADEHAPDNNSPIITEGGVLIPARAGDVAPPEPVADTGGWSSEPGTDLAANPFANDDTQYELEADSVSHAERTGVGREVKYKIFLRFKDSDQLFWRYAHDLRREHQRDKDFLRQINRACAVALAMYRGTAAPHSSDDNYDPGPPMEEEDPGHRGDNDDPDATPVVPGPFPQATRVRSEHEGTHLPPRTITGDELESDSFRRAILTRDARDARALAQDRPRRATNAPKRLSPVFTITCVPGSKYETSVINGFYLLLEDDFLPQIIGT